MKIVFSTNQQVRITAGVTIPADVRWVWSQLRDIQRYGAMDMFHHTIAMDAPTPAADVGLLIEHRLLCFCVKRQGRILFWRENEGYAFSDLSMKDVCRGFPHVFVYRMAPIDSQSCRVCMEVRGRWTATKLPRIFRWLWLRWVMAHVRVSVETTLLQALAAQQRDVARAGRSRSSNWPATKQ